MAPGKFGLFRGRSRECPEPPSTENLLNGCSDLVVYPGSPLPSTSQGLFEDQLGYQELSMLHLDSDDEDESENAVVARRSSDSKVEETQINYKPLPSTTATSTTTLQDSFQDTQSNYDITEDILNYDFQNLDLQNLDNKNHDLQKLDNKNHDLQKLDNQNHDLQKFDNQILDLQKFDNENLHFLQYYNNHNNDDLVTPDDATSIDAHSLQFDQTSIHSGDIKYCGASKKQRRNKAKEEQKIQEQHHDCAMWQASNYEVLQHLLTRNGTLDEQIKWEAIATARGLCTLTATCTCRDCRGVRVPHAVTDGDAGMGAAPLIGAATVGCSVM